MLQIYNILNAFVKYFCNYFCNYFLFSCGLRGWRMLILQFFEGACGFLIGFNRRPPDALGRMVWLFRRHLTVSPVTINRRPSDAQC